MNGRIGRGFLLAVAAAACIAAMGRIDWLAAYGLTSGFFLSAAAMMIPGAFLASLPGRIRRRKEPMRRSGWKGCAACLAGGAALVIGAGIAGGGDGLMLTGLCQGSVSAYVFGGVSAVAGLAAVRLAGRRKQA